MVEKRVGVGTSGDTDWIIDEHFNKFDAAECDVVIVACRSRTGTASVDELKYQNSYFISSLYSDKVQDEKISR